MTHKIGRLATAILLAGWSFVLLLTPARADEESPRAFAARVLDATPGTSFVATMRLTTPGGLFREITASRKKLGTGIDARYLEVTGPINIKDTRYLFFDRTEGEDQQFMYLPVLQRVIRLSEKTRREPFLGSTFYIYDMIQPVLDDFTYAFVGERTVSARNCRLVESVPKDPDSKLYGKTVVAVDPQDLLVLAAELYDREGHLFKVLTVEQIEQIDGHWTALVQRMENAQDQTASRLEILEIRYDVPILDEVFELANLMR